MITVTQASQIISDFSVKTNSSEKLLSEAVGMTLSVDILSPIPMPPFRQSAMDGYAVVLHEDTTYEVIDEVKAGDHSNPKLQKGQCTRIFTGARVPDDADCIVIQEHVDKMDNTVIVQQTIERGQNIRQLGEQIQKDSIALPKGTSLTPAAIGFLAGLGIEKVSVYTPPKVGIIVTGNELIQPGEKLTEGKIYESNSIQLVAVLAEIHIHAVSTYKVPDQYEQTRDTIKDALEQNDLVLLSGGISVGDYDFVKKALEELRTKELFYKIKQKPGKPLYFGVNKDTPLFALPGNPASSLTCFYMYVLPLLQKMMGQTQVGLSSMQKKLTTSFVKKGDRAQFLKARIENDQVHLLDGQSSSMLYTYAIANSLVYIPEDIDTIQKDTLVTTFILPV